MTPALHADKIVVDEASGCWLWTAAVDKDGYAIASQPRPSGGRTCRKAHRILYEHHVGPIPAKHQLDHLCQTRRCVNPAHVEPVVAAVNLQRIHARWLGEIKMTGEALRELHGLVRAGVPYGQLASRFGCSKGELIGVIASVGFQKLSAGAVEQADLLGTPHPDDCYLPAYLQ